MRAVRLIKKEIPDVKAVIIGDGPERGVLENLSKQLDISENVTFLGFLDDHDDVIAHMKASKVFVLPSLWEGFGIAVLEANASGLPVVTVDHEMNASKYLIHQGRNGFISKIDESDFAEKLLAVLLDRKGRKMKNIAIHVASRYDWDEIAGELERYYKSLLGG